MFTIYKTQKLPISVDKAWDFFSDPNNLKEITPPDLALVPTTPITNKMYEGLIIIYKVKALTGISMTWVTEIKNVEHHVSFVDEQRFGPYKFWYHRHTFRPISGGVEIGDLVHYALPVGVFSPMLNDALIAPKLETIFNHRAQALTYKFGNLI